MVHVPNLLQPCSRRLRTERDPSCYLVEHSGANHNLARSQAKHHTAAQRAVSLCYAGLPPHDDTIFVSATAMPFVEVHSVPLRDGITYLAVSNVPYHLALPRSDRCQSIPFHVFAAPPNLVPRAYGDSTAPLTTSSLTPLAPPEDTPVSTTPSLPPRPIIPFPVTAGLAEFPTQSPTTERRPFKTSKLPLPTWLVAIGQTPTIPFVR